MDRDQQELKSIGFSGILKKTFTIIYKERKIFAKITPSFILPLTIFLIGYPQFNVYIISLKMDNYVHELAYEIIYVFLALAGIILSLIFFLLPTSAIVYTMACIYTAKTFTFKTILRVVPNAWIRLMVTFAIQSLIMLAYNFVAILLLLPIIIWLFTNRGKNLLIIFTVLYLIGFVYVCVIGSLANVVTLLEDLKGYGAIKKSKALLKGKRLVASAFFALVGLPVVAIHILYIIRLSRVFSFIFKDLYLDIHRYMEGRHYTDRNNVRYIATLTIKLILHVLIPYAFILVGLVIQTIFYFVCKSYHHEIIDKSYLANHLDNFLPAAACVPSVEKNVDLEHSDV